MKKRSRGARKIRWLRIGVICLILLAIAAAGGWLTGKISSATEQTGYRNTLKEKIKEARAVQKMAEEAVYDRNIDAESFNAIIDYAQEDLGTYIRSLQQGMQEKITPESWQALMNLDNPTDSYRRILSNLNYYSSEQAAAFAHDKDLLEYMAYYPSREDHMTPPETMTSELDWFPYVSQWNPDWAYLNYQDSTIGEAGSRPVTIAMAIKRLSEDSSVTPWIVAQSLDAPLTEEETMLYGTADLNARMVDLFSSYGISETELGADAEAISQALNQSGLILIRAAEGTPDHWMLAANDPDGKLRVLDSESRSNTNKEWTMEELLQKGTQYILLSRS